MKKGLRGGNILLADTSVIVEILRGREKGKAIAQGCATEEIAISAHTAYELLWSRPEEESKVLDMIDHMKVFNYYLKHAIKSAEMKRSLRKRGVALAEIDIFIASVALEEGLTLVTCDKGFEKIHGLQVKVF